MIPKQTLRIAALIFLLLPWCLGLGGRPEKPDSHMYVSKPVKVRIPEKQDKAPGAAKPATRPEASAASAGAAQKPAARQKPSGAEAKRAEIPVSSGADAGSAPADKAVQSAEKELKDLMLTEQEALYGDEQRLYTRKGRVDPFEPFLRKPEPEGGEGKEAEIERRKPQTPLERIALSQLKLTAILQVPSENQAMAMVEDPTGKGYIVKEGTYIGEKGGRVSQILEDRIIIREAYKDVFGKIAEREIEKKLQQ